MTAPGSSAPTPSGSRIVPLSADDEIPDEASAGIREKKNSGARLIYQGQEETRRLALQLLGGAVAFVLLVTAILSGMAIHGGGDEKEWGIAREFLEITFAPLVTLLGAAVAYYYTAK